MLFFGFLNFPTLASSIVVRNGGRTSWSRDWFVSFKDFPAYLWQSEAPAPVHHREIWFSPARFADFAHSFLSKKLSPCLDQLSWLDVEKRSRTSTENAVQNHGKIDVFVAITWWWKFPLWFKKSEIRYHAVS